MRDLARPLRDEVRRDPAHANGRERESDCREDRHDDEHKPLAREGSSEQRFRRFNALGRCARPAAGA
jgi:hypothetical protein